MRLKNISAFILFFLFLLSLNSTAQKADAWLETDEGLGHYDYLEKDDSTWVHWATIWQTWDSAAVWVNVHHEASAHGHNYPSHWVHDNGSEKHLSTDNLRASYHGSDWVAGAAFDLYFKLNGDTLNQNINEMLIIDVQKSDLSEPIKDDSKQLVLQFSIDVGTNIGRKFKRLWVANDGTLQETADIAYDKVKLYYETGTSFSFDGDEDSQSLWGNWGGTSTTDQRWGNETLADATGDTTGIAIPSDGTNKLLCYIVIENFQPNATLGRTAQFKIPVDSIWLDNFGSQAKFQVRIDERKNANALPLTDCSFANDLFISEYIEGSGNNKAIEIYNGTGNDVNLSDYQIKMFFNGNSNSGNNIDLDNSILSNYNVWVLADSSADPAILNKADQINNSSWYNGNDAVALYKKSTASYVDIFGNIGCDPDTSNQDIGWTAQGIQTANKTLVRKPSICTGHITNPGSPPCTFPTLGSAWIQYDQDDFSHLASHTCTNTPPEVLNQPDSTTACENDFAIFSISATGSDSLVFQWYVDTGSGVWTPINDGGNYSGSQTNTLNISNITINMNNYKYYCEVTNSGASCSIDSDIALLNVNPKPITSAIWHN